MVRIRKIEIKHFKFICSVDWNPVDGINCLIGPGDSGKSTILDAIDLCLGARRNLSLADADFFQLDVTQDIIIQVTVGALPDFLKNIEVYGGIYVASTQIRALLRTNLERMRRPC